MITAQHIKNSHLLTERIKLLVIQYQKEKKKKSKSK